VDPVWTPPPTIRIKKKFTQRLGRAITQAVSRWLHTSSARFRARVSSCGICGGQSGAEADFLRVLRFPLPNFIPPIGPESPLSIIWVWYNRPVVAAVPSGLSLTLLRIIEEIIIPRFSEHVLVVTSFNLVSCMDYFSTPKMEATCSSKT
jgi:hypothetical protein